jgi:SIR2-like domain
MIDPILSLAVSVYHNKGVYSLLLGSGISRSSGIPTGWEIVQDLIRKVAHLRKEKCEPDPIAWFTRTFGLEPNYSDVLDQIAKTPAERSQLLRGYFEPTEEELAEGRKTPSEAHKAIAQLIARGYIRVVVTTNFDRLLEQALVKIGIQPVVISTADSVRGALPLAHSPCSIIKINGDYLDTRLKNTRGELERYDEPMDKLLDRVFDEYGVIVAGWSAEWDTALCAAVQRCPNRRFATYWAQRGPLKPTAGDLVVLRGATLVPIADADGFFRELDENVSALETFSATDPLSASVAIARLKKYLSADAYRISLSDLVSTETERAHSAITDSRFSLQSPHNLTGETILKRMQLYEAELGVLLAMQVCGAYWASQTQGDIFLKSFKRIADQSGPEAGKVIWLGLRRYPALVLLYGMGLGALANSNYRFLKKCLDLSLRVDSYKPDEPTATTLHNQNVLAMDAQKVLPGREREHTPLSNHLFEVLREPLREYLSDDAMYEATFDWLEFLFCLAHIDLQVTRSQLREDKAKDPDFHYWAPAGRFCWKRLERNVIQDTEPAKDGTHPPDVVAALQAGFCEAGDGTRTDKYLDIRAALGRFLGRVRQQWGVYF